MEVEKQVYQIIEQINHGLAAQAEQNLESLRDANIDQLVIALLAIINTQQHGSNESQVVGMIQSALLILKTIVPKSWSPIFKEFIGPAPSKDVKASLRQGLLQLLGFHKSKVRNVAALLVARVADAEWPSEWPDLMDTLLAMLANGADYQVYGALSAIKELVARPMNETNFQRVGNTLLGTLYSVAAQRDKYGAHAGAIAVEVFRECIEFLLIEEETQSQLVSTLVVPVINQWCPLFVNYVSLQTDPTDIGYIDLKLESLKSFKAVLTALPRLASAFALEMFEASLNSTVYLLPTYEREFIHGQETSSVESSTDYSIANDVFLHFDLTVQSLMLEQLDYLSMAVELESVVSRLASALPDFVDLLIRMAQIPADMDDWENDMDEFVVEESGQVGTRLARPQIAEILGTVGKQNSIESLLWDRVKGLQETWKLKESGLYLFARVLVENNESITAETVNEFVQLVSDCQRTANPLLRARAYLSASSVCRSLNSRIDTYNLKIPLFEATVNAAVSDPNDTVRISGILSIHKYCNSLPQEYLIGKEQALYEAVYLISSKAHHSTAAVLAEVLVAIAQCDLARAARNPDLVKLLYTLVARDPTNVMLTNEVQDIMAEISEAATDEEVFTEFSVTALEPLTSIIKGAVNNEWSADAVLALGILSAVVTNGPTPLPTGIVDEFFETLVQIAVVSKDGQVLSVTAEILAQLCEYATEQLAGFTGKDGRSGIELLIVAVQNLLYADSNTTTGYAEATYAATGQLILAMLQHFGSMFKELLPELLRATVECLKTDDSCGKGAVGIVRKFVTFQGQSGPEVLDMLSKMDLEKTNGTETALQVVLEKWVESFDSLIGNAEIQEK